MTDHIYAHEHPAAKPPVRTSGPVEGARGNREFPPTVVEEQR